MINIQSSVLSEPCVRVCVCVCIFTCVCVYMDIYICVYLYVFVDRYLCVCVWAFLHSESPGNGGSLSAAVKRSQERRLAASIEPSVRDVLQ